MSRPAKSLVASSIRNDIAAMRIKTTSPSMIDDLTRILVSCLADSSFVFAAAVTAFVVFTHMDDLHNGPLGPFFLEHQDQKIVRWILQNVDKFFGILVFIPMSLRIPRSLRNGVFAGAVLVILMLPPLHIWSYLIAATGILLYINFRTPVYKTVAIAVAGYFVYQDYKAKMLVAQAGGTSAPVAT